MFEEPKEPSGVFNDYNRNTVARAVLACMIQGYPMHRKITAWTMWSNRRNIVVKIEATFDELKIVARESEVAYAKDPEWFRKYQVIAPVFYAYIGHVNVLIDDVIEHEGHIYVKGHSTTGEY